MSELHIDARVVEHTDAMVHVTYSIENTTGTDILVCHRLYRERTPNGSYVVDPHLVYVLFEPGPVPNITKRILDRGEDVNVEHPIQPLARVMAACTSVAAPSRLLDSANCSVIVQYPCRLALVTSSSPGICMNCRSSGVAMVEATVSGLAPG